MTSRRDSIDAVRRFNRHYVPAMRLLDRYYLDTGMSTLETAALLEIGENEGCSARDIARLLHMDKGQLSRALSRFESEGLVRRTASETDARVQRLWLTDAGHARVAELARMGEGVVEDAFAGATNEELAEVAEALEVVLRALGDAR